MEGVEKRTRLQRAIQEQAIRERAKQARLEALIKYRKEINLVISNDDDGEEEVAKVVDEEEYNRHVPPPYFGGNASFDVNGFCFNGVVGGGSNGMNPVYENGDQSDDSLQILGERWNLMILGDFDDIVDRDDKDKDFDVDGRRNCVSSDEFSSPFNDFSDTTKSDSNDSDYGKVVRRRKKVVVDGDAKERAKEKRKERRMGRMEKGLEEGIGVGGVKKSNASKKKRNR